MTCKIITLRILVNKMDATNHAVIVVFTNYYLYFILWFIFKMSPCEVLQPVVKILKSNISDAVTLLSRHSVVILQFL